MIVSGSLDLTCILWDLEELSYITQLTGHAVGVSALAFNDLTVSNLTISPPPSLRIPSNFVLSMCSQPSEEAIHTDGPTNPFTYLLLYLPGRENIFFFPSLQGEIASCAGPVIYLWNMKGQLLTSTSASCGPQMDIQCVLFTQRHEWDPKNVIVTGCSDGVIRVKTFFCLHACMFYCTETFWLVSSILGAEPAHACGSIPLSKLASTRVWTPIIALLLPRVLRRGAYAGVCHYLELCLFFRHSLRVSHADMEDGVHQNTITWPSRRARVPRAKWSRKER